jgi:hypothetical protein
VAEHYYTQIDYFLAPKACVTRLNFVIRQKSAKRQLPRLSPDLISAPSTLVFKNSFSRLKSSFTLTFDLVT